MSIAPSAPVAAGNPSRACWEARALFRSCLAMVGGLDRLVNGCSVCSCGVCCERCRGGEQVFPAAAAMLTVASAASVRHWARSSAASLPKLLKIPFAKRRDASFGLARRLDASNTLQSPSQNATLDA